MNDAPWCSVHRCLRWLVQKLLLLPELLGRFTVLRYVAEVFNKPGCRLFFASFYMCARPFVGQRCKHELAWVLVYAGPQRTVTSQAINRPLVCRCHSSAELLLLRPFHAPTEASLGFDKRQA